MQRVIIPEWKQLGGVKYRVVCNGQQLGQGEEKAAN